jgi:hypothetical protein
LCRIKPKGRGFLTENENHNHNRKQHCGTASSKEAHGALCNLRKAPHVT